MTPEQCQYCQDYKRPNCLTLGRPVRRKQKAKTIGYTRERLPVTCFKDRKGILIDISHAKAAGAESKRAKHKKLPNTNRRRMNNTHFKN